MFTNWWNSQTLRKQLQYGALTQAIITIIVFAIVIIIALSVLGQNLRNQTQQAFQQQGQQSAQRIVTSAAKVVDTQFQEAATSAVILLSMAFSDINRTDYPFASLTSYYEWTAFMQPPLVIDARYNSNVSYSDGDYNVAYGNPYHLSNLDAALNQTISRTESLEPTMKRLYFSLPQFVSLYACFEQDGFFREYPGVSNGNFNQLITYDCRSGYDGDWYLLGKAVQHQSLFTGVYIDPWILQSMVTTVRSIHQVDTGQFVGVSSGDMLTNSLQPTINNAKYLSNGRAVLFETATGYVISDSTWLSSRKQLTLSTYDQLQGISLSSDDWQNINNGQLTSSTELSDYYVISQQLATGNGQYLLSSFVSKDDLFSVSLYPMLRSIDHMNAVNGGILAGVLVGLLIFVPLGMFWLVNALMKPIQRVIDDAQTIVQNLGQVNLAQGLVGNQLGAGPAEAQQLNAAMNQLVQNLTQQRQRAQPQQANNPNKLNVIVQNQFYGKIKSSNSRSARRVEIGGPQFHHDEYEIKITVPQAGQTKGPGQEGEEEEEGKSSNLNIVVGDASAPPAYED